MKIKKFTAITLIISMVIMNYLPLTCHAIGINDSNIKTKKVKVKNKKQKNNPDKISYINIQWWEDYNDEYLNEYVLKAVKNNYDLKVATLKVEEARQATKLQFSQELPTLSVGASPLLYKMPGVGNTEGLFSVPIIATYEIDLFLKNHDKTKSQRKIYEASKLNEKSAYISVVSAVGTAYYNIVKIDKLIELQEEIINDRKEIFGLMKLCNEQGIVSTADMTRAEKAYTLALTDMFDLKKARTVMLNSLAVLIGESPNNIESFKRISYDDLKKQKAIPTEISSDIIVSRPDYLVAETMVQKAGIDVRVAKKEFLPKFDIVGLIGFNYGSNMFKSMNWTNALATLGGAALLPIFTGGARIANFKMQKVRYEQTMQNYYKTNITAIKEVNDALSNLKLDEEKYQVNLQTLNMEKADFKYTMLKYNEGIISKLDLLQKRETLLVIEKMVASNKINCYVNQIGLYKAVAAQDITSEKVAANR